MMNSSDECDLGLDGMYVRVMHENGRRYARIVRRTVVTPEFNAHDAIAFDETASASEAAAAIAFGIGYCLAEQARIDIGTTVAVAGNGPVADAAVAVALLRGALRCATSSPSAVASTRFEVAAPADEVSKKLSGKPSAVVALANSGCTLNWASAICATQGTLVFSGFGRQDLDLYHHAHRRGLTMVAWPVSDVAPLKERWARITAAFERCQRDGLLPALTEA